MAPVSDLLEWSLHNPNDPKQPAGFWFFSAMTVIFDEFFRGKYADSTRPVEHLTRSFAQPLWGVYCLQFLAAKTSSEASNWLQAIALERLNAGDVYEPIDPHFDKMPGKMIDCFHTGVWCSIDSIRRADELPITFLSSLSPSMVAGSRSASMQISR
jgi:hypothetical protein